MNALRPSASIERWFRLHRSRALVQGEDQGACGGRSAESRTDHDGVSPAQDVAIESPVFNRPCRGQRRRLRLLNGFDALRVNHDTDHADAGSERGPRRENRSASHSAVAADDDQFLSSALVGFRLDRGDGLRRPTARSTRRRRGCDARSSRATRPMSTTRMRPQCPRAISWPRFMLPNVIVRSASTAPSDAPVVASTPVGRSRATTMAPWDRASAIDVMATAIGPLGGPEDPVPSSASTTTPSP